MTDFGKHLLIGGRYRVDFYEDTNNSGGGKKLAIGIMDIKDEHMRGALLIDKGSDGSLDEVYASGKQPVAGEYRDIFAKARAAVHKLLPLYRRRFEELAQGAVLKREYMTVIRTGDGRYCVGLDDERREHSMNLAISTSGEIREIDGIRISDRNLGLNLILGLQDESKDILEGVRTYLAPVFEFIEIPDEKCKDTVVDTEWLAYLHSIKGGDGEKIAKIALEEVSRGISSKNPCKVYDRAAIDLIRKHGGEPTVDEFRAFIAAETEAEKAVEKKIFDVLATDSYASSIAADHEGFDILGRVALKGRGKQSSILDALGPLLGRLSGGKIRLKENTFQYLNSVLEVKGNTLCFKDPAQNGGQSIPIPMAELIMLAYGQQPVHKPGVNIDGYYLHDEDGDGKIHANRDAVSRKETLGGPIRILYGSSINDMLNEFGDTPPPPFDPGLFYTDGVPIEDIRSWASTIHSRAIKKRTISSNPLGDGKYKVLIYRAHELDPDGWFLKKFISMNGFDDVYVVPLGWGMELALNEIAARGIPVDEIYIGTHGWGMPIMEAILMDFDRKLVLADGARVTFTGCNTPEAVAYMLGTQLFMNSSGSMVWSDRIVIPSPFGSILSFGAKETFFDHGRVVKSKEEPLVDPIPGNFLL